MSFNETNKSLSSKNFCGVDFGGRKNPKKFYERKRVQFVTIHETRFKEAPINLLEK
jgi:hypothetical protein